MLTADEAAARFAAWRTQVYGSTGHA
jgi:hypothetical protein